MNKTSWDCTLYANPTCLGTVAFSPHLYANGYVCLSILGTWVGPDWTPAMNLSSTFISIQSLLCYDPDSISISNDPDGSRSKRYNAIIEHECLRVAVCGQLEHALDRQTETLSPAFAGHPAPSAAASKQTPMPEEFYGVMRSHFGHFYDSYIHRCRKNEHLDGSEFQDPMTDNRGTFEFGRLRRRLECIRERLQKKRADLQEDTDGQSRAERQDIQGMSNASSATASSTAAPAIGSKQETNEIPAW